MTIDQAKDAAELLKSYNQIKAIQKELKVNKILLIILMGRTVSAPSACLMNLTKITSRSPSRSRPSRKMRVHVKSNMYPKMPNRVHILTASPITPSLTTTDCILRR